MSDLLRSPGQKLSISAGDIPRAEERTIADADVQEGPDLLTLAGGVDAVGKVSGAISRAANVIAETVRIEDNISLRIGKVFIFPSVVLTGVGAEFELKLDRYTGQPIAATVHVGFRTLVTPRAEDLPAIMG